MRVAYADTDQMAMVYHANYLVWFERGRTEAMRELGLAYAALEARGLLLPVVEAGIRFRAPARYDDVLAIETVVATLGPASIGFRYRVRRVEEAEETEVSRPPGRAREGFARPSERGASGGQARGPVLRAGAKAPPILKAPAILVQGFTEHACATREGRVVRIPDDVRAVIEPVVAAGGSGARRSRRAGTVAPA